MAKKGKQGGDGENPVLAELNAIKRLLAVSLVHAGVKRGDVASALDVSTATISRMVPKGVGKPENDRG